MDEQNELVEVAMQIILKAGDARNCATEALKFAKKGDFDSAQEYYNKAVENITLAHKAQTNVIQAEARGESHDYNLLFAHAQDTLMTIKSELFFVEEMIDVLKIVYTK